MNEQAGSTAKEVVKQPANDYAFANQWQENARLALDTIAMLPTPGIPTWIVHDMQWSHLEEID